MKTVVYAAAALALAVPGGPSMALSGPPQPAVQRTLHPELDIVSWRDPAHRHRPRYGGYVGANGGYRVNRYGYGNYVGGPNGGFAGYPAGSAGAQIYRQKQEWKCQDVPEMC